MTKDMTKDDVRDLHHLLVIIEEGSAIKPNCEACQRGIEALRKLVKREMTT